MSEIEKKLSAMGITLPPSVLPPANYLPYVTSGNLVFISGQLPMEGGKPQGIGKLGDTISLEEGQNIAKLCGINILSHLNAACDGNLDRVKRCVRLGIFGQFHTRFHRPAESCQRRVRLYRRVVRRCRQTFALCGWHLAAAVRRVGRGRRYV